MDRLELARRLFGDGVEGTSTFHPAETQTYIGTAVSDSADGLVRVDIGNSTTEDGEEGIEVATTVSVKEGEEVYVTAVGGTVAKSYYVSGVVGLGDETNSRITAIETDYVKATMLEADLAEIGVLTADSAVISELQAETAKVENVTADQLEASTAYIGALQTGNVTAQNIIADKAKLAQIDTAQISADHAVINTLDSNYAKIDLANVSNAWIDDGVIRDAAIGDAQIADISANKLTAGTINGSVINVTNLNATNITTGTINGQRLGEGSIALSKLSESVYTEGEVDAIVDTLNNRIDSAIETWTATAVPTLSNYPASSWDTDDERAEHVGDICYVLNAGSETDGYTYRFAYDNSTGTYQWVLIKDNQVTAALQRLVDAEGDIDSLQSFQSETSVWISDTDEALNVIRSNHTSLTTVVNKTIVETVQLWYSKANTTAPAKPTSQVTSTSTSGGAWRTVVPSYSTSYPNYFYCYQWKYADGTYGWSSVTRDIAMGEAQSTSRTAASDASTAKSDAATAVSTANTASANASTAMSDASTAKANAETAISTANSASSTATAAASDASTAKSDAASAVTTANSNIKSNVQLWYTKQTSTAPSKPNAHVTTNNAGTPNAWNVAVPTYNATYPHYFYCYEYQLGNGTYGWTNVVYDSAMTESQERARTAVSDAAAAQSTANSASTAASAAQSAADSAATAAGNAQATANKNVKTSIQLWYTKADETAPAKPIAKVTSNSTSGGGWRIVVPSYNASYPKYFYCYQYELADGTYTWSDVVFDRATTENEANAHSAMTQLTTKVDTSTFNDLTDTVSEHTRKITNLTTITTSNGLTADTNITNTVNTVSQTATSNSSKLTQLMTTLGTNADGTSKAGDIVHRTSAVEQDLSGFKSTVSETYATKTEVRRTDTGSGTVVTSDDAANLPPLALTVHGKSVQDGTPTPSAPVEIESVEAPNLLDYEAWKSVGITNGTAVFENNGVTLTASANDCFTATAVPTAARVPVTEGEVVYLTWDSPDTYSGYCYIFPNGTTSGMKSSDNSGARFVQYVVAAGITYISFRMGVATAGNTIHYENIRITKTRATEYAPKGSIGVRSSRNLFNGISVAQNVTNGVTWSYDADSNRLKASGTPTANNNDLRIYFKTPITVPEGVTSLTFSFDGTFVSSNTYFFMYDNANGWSYRNITSEGKCTFTDMGGHAFSYCMIRTYTNSGNISIDATIQVEYGTEATEHALYSPAVAYIDLQGHALRSLPDGTEDTLEVDGEGNVTLTKRVGSTVLDGNRTWYLAASGGVNYASTNVSDSFNTNRVIHTDTFLISRFDRSSSRNPDTSYQINNTFTFWTGGTFNPTTKDDVAAWFASNPTTVVYKLATPQTISLGKIDLPSLPSPTFSVYVDAAVSPTLDAEWWTQGGEEVGSVYQRTSALEQTSHGFTIRMDGIDGDISDLSGDLSDLSGDLSDLSKDAVLKSKDTWTAWMDVGTDSNNDPYLTMGQSGNAFESRLTNRYMSFNEGTVELMRLSGEDGVKADTIRSKYVYIGSWILEQLDNGDMAIKLVGGE